MVLRFKFTAAVRLVFLAAAFFIFPFNSNAAGVLDPTFGTNGRVSMIVGSGARANAAALQSDGKIVVVGYVFRAASQRDIVVARFNANGTPDLSFGENGRVVAAISNRNETAHSVAIDASGRIVVVGSIEPVDDSPITDFLVVRFTQTGALDTSFGNGGVVTVSQGSSDSFNAVAIQPNGRIVAAGGTSDGGLAVLMGFTPQGAIDIEFGDLGLNFFNVPGMNDEQVQVILFRPNGEILVGGQGNVSIPHPGVSSFLAEFDSAGSQSQDFGTNGIVTFSVGTVPFGYDLALLQDGSALVLSDILCRVSTAGAVSNFANNINGSEIAVRSDGRFIVANSVSVFGFQSRAFAPNGRFIGRARDLTANDLLVQPDDKIIFVSSTDTDFVVTRILGITSQGTRLADYDADEKTDIAVFRPSNATLYSIRSSNDGANATFPSGEASLEIRRVIPENYGNSLSFPFVYWKTAAVGNTPGTFCSTNGIGNRQCIQWGLGTDVPVGGDYDGDTLTDIAVYRPSEGVWYIWQSSNNQIIAVRWGLSEDKPVPADYDYDGITDIAVYRPSDGTWYVRRSSDNNLTAVRWGIQTDIPLTGDFDGDGRADFVVYRPSESTWYLLQTRNGFRAERFGLENDQPVPGDYDGDGRHDIAVFRQGFWYILGSTRGFYGLQWGQPNDVPVAVRYAY
ncbi:MAG: FG-GAP-like repeat-containing protein [Acidobacteriota bacterium]|nr:FG-GAP-like repeat-containing protein [Acidobacteriota bacterium]